MILWLLPDTNFSYLGFCIIFTKSKCSKFKNIYCWLTNQPSNGKFSADLFSPSESYVFFFNLTNVCFHQKLNRVTPGPNISQFSLEFIPVAVPYFFPVTFPHHCKHFCWIPSIIQQVFWLQFEHQLRRQSKMESWGNSPENLTFKKNLAILKKFTR